MSTSKWITATALGLLGAAAALSPAAAQNEVSVGSSTAAPGAAVEIPISATTDKNLTLLSFDVSFDAKLCHQIQAQEVRKAGRAVAQIEQDGLRCPNEGKVSFVFLNLVGDPVIPAGSGPIATWGFTLKADAPGGTYPLDVTVKQANYGPVAVPMQTSGGSLTVAGAAVAGQPAAVVPEPASESGACSLSRPARAEWRAVLLLLLPIGVLLRRRARVELR